MKSKPYLLFDAGGTLVFPNPNFLITDANKLGIHLNHEQLFDGYYKLIYHLDRQADLTGIFPENHWPDGYVTALFEYGLKIHDPKVSRLNKLVIKRHEKRSLWTFTYPNIRELIAFLSNTGYRMSIISNSNGDVSQVIRNVGLFPYFDYIFSSKELKSEKPDPKIFKKAINIIGIDPGNALFIGDIYHVDVKGANLANIGAIHLDPLEKYNSVPGIHLPNIEKLKEFLVSYIRSPQYWKADLFPFCEVDGKPFSRSYQEHEIDKIRSPRNHFWKIVPPQPLPHNRS